MPRPDCRKRFRDASKGRTPSIEIRRGRNARKMPQWGIFSEGRAAAQGMYVAGAQSARKTCPLAIVDKEPFLKDCVIGLVTHFFRSSL